MIIDTTLYSYRLGNIRLNFASDKCSSFQLLHPTCSDAESGSHPFETESVSFGEHSSMILTVITFDVNRIFQLNPTIISQTSQKSVPTI